MRGSDRRALGALGLLAIVIAVSVAIVLASRGGGTQKASGSAGPPVRVATDLSPRAQLFGDTLTAQVEVVVDAARVDPASVRVRGSFGAYERVGVPVVSRHRADGYGVVLWTARLRCLEDTCLVGKDGKRVVFPPARVTYSTARGAGSASRAVVVRWPAVQEHSRLDTVEIAAVDPRDEPPWRADLALVPGPSYRIRPNLLAALVFLASAVLIAGFVVAVYPLVLRELGGSRRRRKLERLSPYEQALALLETDMDGVEAQRQALELVAAELGRRGDEDLELSARRLAWSADQPAYEDRKALAESARRLNGERRGTPA